MSVPPCPDKVKTRPDIEANLDHVERLDRKRRMLTAAQEQAEQALCASIGRAYKQGDIDVTTLQALYLAYRSTALVGFGERWNANVPVRYTALRPSSLPNAPHGSWSGETSRPAQGDPAPAAGVAVVYVLYDISNVPCYVGSTAAFCARLKKHADDGKAWARWRAHQCRDREHAYVEEVRLLAEHKPYLNRKVGR